MLKKKEILSYATTWKHVMDIKLSKISLLLFVVWSLHPCLCLQEIMQLQRLLESRLHVVFHVRHAAENAFILSPAGFRAKENLVNWKQLGIS